MSKVRTRFAPSPTGRMHVGNLRSALYEFLIAKHEGGDFMLRIEDTDQERFVEGAVDIIYRTLAETGLVHDEGPDKDGGYGPYVQSERMKTGIYMKYAKELVEKGEAYYCFCDKERLSTLKTEVVEGKEIMIYDKHCLSLSKEEVEANDTLKTAASVLVGKPKVLPHCKDLRIGLNYLHGDLPDWLLHHPYLMFWSPEISIFNQNRGKDDQGIMPGFSNVPTSFEYFYELYPILKPKY